MHNHNHIILEMLALEKFKENLRVAEQDRIVARVPRDPSRSIWKRLVSWTFAEKSATRKPARA